MANEQKREIKSSDVEYEHMTQNLPAEDKHGFAQDLPGASRGSRQRWRSMINGGAADQPDKDVTARHDPPSELPARPVQPGANLSGIGEHVSPHTKPQ